GEELAEPLDLDGGVVLGVETLAFTGDPERVSGSLGPGLLVERHVLFERAGLREPQMGADLRRRIVEHPEQGAVADLDVRNEPAGRLDQPGGLVDDRAVHRRGIQDQGHRLSLHARAGYVVPGGSRRTADHPAVTYPGTNPSYTRSYTRAE